MVALFPSVDAIFVVVAVATFAAVALNWIQKSFVCKLAYSGALNKLFHCCAYTHTHTTGTPLPQIVVKLCTVFVAARAALTVF